MRYLRRLAGQPAARGDASALKHTTPVGIIELQLSVHAPKPE